MNSRKKMNTNLFRGMDYDVLYVVWLILDVYVIFNVRI